MDSKQEEKASKEKEEDASKKEEKPKPAELFSSERSLWQIEGLRTAMVERRLNSR